MTAEQTLIDYLPHPAAVIDSTGAVVSANCQFYRGFGSDADGQGIITLISRSLDQRSERQGGESQGGEWRPSGNWRDDRIILERGVQCGPDHLRVISLDRYRSLFVCAGGKHDRYDHSINHIQRHRSLLGAVLRSTDYAVFLVREDGTILEYNPAAFTLVGEASLQLTGSPLDQVLPLRQRDKPLETLDLIRRAISRGEDSLFSADITLQDPRFLTLSVELEVFPVGDCACHASHGGGATCESCECCAVVTVKSVEEKRRIWSDLRHVHHAANVTRAVSGIVHELINGCTALFGQIDLVQQESGHDLSMLSSVVRRIQRLGYRLGSFAGAERQDEAPPDSVEEAVINAVDLALSGTSVRATFSFAQTNAPLMLASDKLSQVIFNLVTNAVEAMPEGGVVHVESRLQSIEGVLVISVRDEGHGMDPRMLEEAVKPYYTTREKGVGMGLTVSASILDECGGRMILAADPGFGTTVDLYVPFARTGETPLDERMQDIPQPHSAPESPDMQGLPVLLVEDDNLVRRSMEQSLRVLGCEVTTVENGDRALPMIQARLGGASPFRLLITDLTMPGRLDGVGLLRRVRELDPDIPAILSTGTLHYHRGKLDREAGFQAVLRKPFGLDQLRDSIRTAFRPAS